INNVLLNRKGTLIETDVVDHGETLWFLINFQPVMDDEGHVNGIVIISNDITDRKKSESEMQKLSQAVEQSTSLIQIMDTSGKIEYVNPRFSEVTGYTFDEAAGRHFDDLPLQKKRLNTDETKWEMLNRGETWEGEISNTRKDGSLIWLKTIISPVTNHKNEVINMIAVMEDITAHKKAEVKEKKIRQNLLLLNDTALKILAQPPGVNIFEIIGEQLSKLYPTCLFAVNSFNPKTRQIKTEYIHSEGIFLEKFITITTFSLRGMSYKLSDKAYDTLISGNLEKIEGGLYEILIGKVPKQLCTQAEKLLDLNSFYSRGIVQNDKLYGSVVIVNIKGRETVDPDLLSNLLTQAALGIERRNLEEELRSAKESAEEMNHLKSVFLANMSHELRTPLNGILGFSELLIENIEEDRMREMARVVNRSGNRLLDTLNTILDFSMIESRNVILNYSDEDINILVGGIVNQFRQEAEKKGLTLNFQAPKKTIRGYVVKDIIGKIIRQLLSNAIKFTNKGNVTLKVHTKSGRNYTFMHIDVIDTGQGIPEAEQKHIFEEFRQGSEGFSRRFEGTGLGLTICRKFTSMLHGDISVSSGPDKGSVFTVSIPLHSNDPNEQS
ncbi:MAG TPA: PAS domain S-box protein, partial [Bacteroidales bacterium]|nr:PAS domain S-box protein [Bacteroidales bacterium]